MDEIRCDEPSYLIWKWHPAGSQKGNNRRENAIRWGSSLRVKDGEVAVFVYNQPDGPMQDFIVGPYDEIVKTDNFPVLASIIGLAYDGGTPFQAEVYYINLARIIQIPFAVPYFDLYDPRFLDFSVPTAVRGKITFHIADYQEFIKLHRLSDFDLGVFQTQIRDAMARYVKGIVANTPIEKNIPVVQIEREIPLINELVEADVKERFERDFGVDITAVDINAIEVDKTSEGYQQLKSVTQDLATATVKAQTEVNIKNMRDMQQINADNTEAVLKAQREEAQYMRHIKTQTENFATHQLNQQTAVGIAGAEALGNMGTHGGTEIGGGGEMNMTGIMTGMAMGGAIGQNMAGVMNNMMSGMNQTPTGATPPPVPNNMGYFVAVDGKPTGAYDVATLSQMALGGQFTKDSLVWKDGMNEWLKAETVQELQGLFAGEGQTVSDMPPIPDV